MLPEEHQPTFDYVIVIIQATVWHALRLKRITSNRKKKYFDDDDDDDKMGKKTHTHRKWRKKGSAADVGFLCEFCCHFIRVQAQSDDPMQWARQKVWSFEGKKELSAHIMLMHFNDAATVAVNNFLKCSKWLISHAHIMCWFLILYIRNRLDETAVTSAHSIWSGGKRARSWVVKSAHLKRTREKKLLSRVQFRYTYSLWVGNELHLHAEKSELASNVHFWTQNR